MAITITLAIKNTGLSYTVSYTLCYTYSYILSYTHSMILCCYTFDISIIIGYTMA